MKKYYVVYDMSPLEKGKDYIQVAIGEQNDEFLAGDQHYDAKSPHFWPEDAALDSSGVLAGHSDVYQDPKYLNRLENPEDPDGWKPAEQRHKAEETVEQGPGGDVEKNWF